MQNPDELEAHMSGFLIKNYEEDYILCSGFLSIKELTKWQIK